MTASPESAKERIRGAAKTAALSFALWRGLTFLLVWLSYHLLDFAKLGGTPRPELADYLRRGYVRHDAKWYLEIAAKGYRGGPRAAFFPGFPYAARYLGLLLGGSTLLAGVLLSNVATLAGLLFMVLIARQQGLSEGRSERALALLLLWPASYYLSTFYSEGLFFGLAAASLFCFGERRYLLCGVIGALALFTRSAGLALFGAVVVALCWRAYRERAWPPKAAGWLLLMPLGLVAFMAMLRVQVGSAWAFVGQQQRWNRHLTFPLATPVKELARVQTDFPRSAGNVQILVQLASALLFLACGGVLLARCSPELGLFTLGGALLPLCSGNSMALIRFVAVLFPGFFQLAAIGDRRPQRRIAIIATVAMLHAIYHVRYVIGAFNA